MVSKQLKGVIHILNVMLRDLETLYSYRNEYNVLLAVRLVSQMKREMEISDIVTFPPKELSALLGDIFKVHVRVVECLSRYE